MHACLLRSQVADGPARLGSGTRIAAANKTAAQHFKKRIVGTPILFVLRRRCPLNLRERLISTLIDVN
jgi:hypothetical protein